MNKFSRIALNIVIFFGIGYLISSYIINKEKEEIEEKRKVEQIKKLEEKKEIEEIKRMRELERIKRENEQRTKINEYNKKENQKIIYTKYFKIKHEILDNKLDYSLASNVATIVNELEKIKSLEEDKDYEIEIVGSISVYGNLFYKIYKKSNSSKYDYEFKNSLENLKKMKFREQKNDGNFIIKIDNNSDNLN